MPEQIEREIMHPDGQVCVLIVRRGDGRFTYRVRRRDGLEWAPPSLDKGVYDSPETAETEARQREPWLKALFS